MQYFIHKIVRDTLKLFNSYTDVVFILPGKRPIVFFNEVFKENKYNGILPEFITIEEWKEQIAEVSLHRGINSWLSAFLSYKEIDNEPFDEFIKWIPTTLKDFDDIDIFTDSPNQLLDYMISIERIENWELETSLTDNNVFFWKKLTLLYDKIAKKLANQSVATVGQLNRKAVENIEQYADKNIDKKFVFIGFNAFNPQEEKLINILYKKNELHFYWNADIYYIKNTIQEAGMFLRKYFNNHIYSKDGINWIENEFMKPKKIMVVSCSKQVSQVKYAGNLLQDFTEEELHETAIVLCDEQLLGSVIESIPSKIDKVNVTMGFPLKLLPQANLFEKILNLKIQLEKRKGENLYYKEVLEVLDELIPSSNDEKMAIDKIKLLINEEYKIYFTIDFIKEILQGCSFCFIFEYQTINNFLISIRNYCIELYSQKDSNIIYKEALIRFSEIFTQLHTQLSQVSFNLNYESFQKLFLQVLKIEKINFVGNPLGGLQIMGLLETRLLNFKNIIMLSVNEGMLPLGRTENSFIPYDVKRKYGINTFEENDAIYAYHFHRLLQHASTVHLLYNSHSEGMQSAEKSRFITQLEMETSHTIVHKIATIQSSTFTNSLMEIEKTPIIHQKLLQWVEKGISPSHLTSYLYNPKSFYYSKILKINTIEEIEEHVSAINFGNIVHLCLHNLYKPLVTLKMKDEKLLFKQYNSIEKELNNAIEQLSNKELFNSGYNYLQKMIMQKSIEKVLQYDINLLKNGNILSILSLEEYWDTQLILTGNQTIKVLGYIDRVDCLNDTIRIIDYKYGISKNLIISVKNFNEFAINPDYNHSLQLIMYAFMLLNNRKYTNVQCGIWSLKTPYRGVQNIKLFKNDLLSLDNITELLQKIKDLILEILNLDILFIEREIKEFNY